MKVEDKIFFERNKTARKVFLKLDNDGTWATPLSKELKLYREAVSRAFRELKETGFIECTNPTSSNYKTYKLSQKGKMDFNEIKKLDSKS